jgi:hypothetical protein
MQEDRTSRRATIQTPILSQSHPEDRFHRRPVFHDSARRVTTTGIKGPLPAVRQSSAAITKRIFMMTLSFMIALNVSPLRLLPIEYQNDVVRLIIYVDAFFSNRIGLTRHNYRLCDLHRLPRSETDRVYSVADPRVGR